MTNYKTAGFFLFVGGLATLWSAEDHSRVNSGRTTSKSGHPYPCQNCSGRTPAEKTVRESVLKRLSCSLDDPFGYSTDPYSTEVILIIMDNGPFIW